MTDLKRVAAQARHELSLTSAAFDGLEAAMMAEMFRTTAEQSIKREKLFFGVRAIRMAKESLIRAARENEAIVNYEQLLSDAGFTSNRA